MEGGKRREGGERREEGERRNASQGRQNWRGGCWHLSCLLITLVMMDSKPPGGTFLQEEPECQHQLFQRPMARADKGKAKCCWDVPAVTPPVLVSNGMPELCDLGCIHSGWGFLQETNPACHRMGKQDISDNMIVSRRKATTSTEYKCTNISSKERTSRVNVMISSQTSDSEASL